MFEMLYFAKGHTFLGNKKLAAKSDDEATKEAKEVYDTWGGWAPIGGHIKGIKIVRNGNQHVKWLWF